MDERWMGEVDSTLRDHERRHEQMESAMGRVLESITRMTTQISFWAKIATVAMTLTITVIAGVLVWILTGGPK